MLRMNSFLRDARKWLKLKQPTIIVVGNESCDLDSAVCAIGLAYFYSKSRNFPDYLYTNGERRFLPIMNISRQNLQLKREVMYYMHEHDIELENLVCREEVPKDLLSMSRFVLVDHHISTFSISNQQIIQILDHRPIDQNNIRFPNGCRTRILEYGSCATLVADEVFKAIQLHEDFYDLFYFLRGPIVLDTVNFSDAAGKAKALDIEINGQIERILSLTEDDRFQLFNTLSNLMADVTTLNAFQILSKDLKTVSNFDKSVFVAIPGFPILVEEYFKMENVWDLLTQFAIQRKCYIILLMGVEKQPSGEIRRDLALIQMQGSDVGTRLVAALARKADFLQLKQKDLNPPDSIQCQLYEQKNVQASRKQVLPIVQKVLDNDDSGI